VQTSGDADGSGWLRFARDRSDTTVLHREPGTGTGPGGPPVGGRDEPGGQDVEPLEHRFELFTGPEVQVAAGRGIVLLDLLRHLVVLVLWVEGVTEDDV